jgi:eukaryotic-like serine/threonine-protein kinase
MSAHHPDIPADPRASQLSGLNPAKGPVRRFGRWQLLRLLGKSDHTMAWLVDDPRCQEELLLLLPRVQPAGPRALAMWQQSMRRAGRINHPQLAQVLESGVQDGWPFATYELAGAACLADRVPEGGTGGPEAAAWFSQALTGLAFAHEAGVTHQDLQPFMLWVGDNGQVRVAGLGVVAGTGTGSLGDGGAARNMAGIDATDTSELQAHRDAAERDVLAVGILLHMALCGQAALGEADVGRVINRLPPYCSGAGRDIVRLPWAGTQLLADPLRAIANRATDRQLRQRYRSARTFLGALEGWQRTEEGEGGPLALLADRMRAAGVLPSFPGAAARAARLATMERERTNDLAEVVLQDLALSFDLLRLVNSAHVRGAQVSGSGPVLTVRRAIAMLGMDGVRHAATALREWPGPMNEDAAAALLRLVERCKRAARLALLLRPAGFDAEVMYLICLLQNLGRLLVQYHFPEEALQIQRLTQPGAPGVDGEPEATGMTEETAAFAVLGADIEAIGSAVARHWGMDDAVLTMVRRLPTSTAVHMSHHDDDQLRTVASCANEALDALTLPAHRVAAGLQRVVQRYGRSLGFGTRDLQAALQTSTTSSYADLTGTGSVFGGLAPASQTTATA